MSHSSPARARTYTYSGPSLLRSVVFNALFSVISVWNHKVIVLSLESYFHVVFKIPLPFGVDVE